MDPAEILKFPPVMMMSAKGIRAEMPFMTGYAPGETVPIATLTWKEIDDFRAGLEATE